MNHIKVVGTLSKGQKIPLYFFFFCSFSIWVMKLRALYTHAHTSTLRQNARSKLLICSKVFYQESSRRLQEKSHILWKAERGRGSSVFCKQSRSNVTVNCERGKNGPREKEEEKMEEVGSQCIKGEAWVFIWCNKSWSLCSVQASLYLKLVWDKRKWWNNQGCLPGFHFRHQKKDASYM